MAVGCIITLSPELRILDRKPFWPWPAPGEYPKYLPSGEIQMFFPFIYTRFRLGFYLRSHDIFPYFPENPPMKIVARNVPLTLVGTPYTCDILLGLYANTERAAILLCDSRPEDYPGDRSWAGEPVAVASTNAPAEYLQHLDHSHTAIKDWSENEGILPQLLSLTDENSSPLFYLTPHKITLGFCTAPIIQLGTLPLALHRELRKERKETQHV